MNLEQYKLVNARRQAYDTFIWQTPTLAVATQSFLLTIALGPYTAQLPRLLASGLALLTSSAAIQLMYKHRQHERLDRAALVKFEDENSGYETINARPEIDSKSPLLSASSYRLWIIVLGLFGVASLTTAISAAVEPSLLAASDPSNISEPVAAAITRVSANQSVEISKLRAELILLISKTPSNSVQSPVAQPAPKSVATQKTAP